MADYNDSNAPGTGYQSYGSGDNWVDPSIEAQRLAAEKAQADYTAKHAMSREDFIKKYAIGEGGTFVANDKGGNAASEVAGQSVAEYYDKYLDPERKPAMQSQMVADGDMREVDTNQWSNDGKYRDAHPYFDAWDNVNPHPESQLGNGWDEAWKQIGRPVATAAAMYFGVGALGAATAGWSAAGATGAAAATPATGLAGTLGMNAGIGATALNAGALNTGISLVQGKNIGDSLKSGVMAAALSPVGGWAKSAIGGAASGVLGKTAGGIVGNIGAGAATGAAGAALTGQDIGKGFTNGIISGAINSVGGAAGKLAKEATGSNLVGGVTSAAVSNTLSPKKKNITTAAINGALDDFTDPMASVNKYLGFAAA
mgnify:CR=1 FL=1